MTRHSPELKRAVIELAGRQSYGQMARKFGLTRNAVAGILFRYRYPVQHRIRCNGGRSPNKIGTGLTYRT
jgi:hypothetical protein